MIGFTHGKLGTRDVEPRKHDLRSSLLPGITKTTHRARPASVVDVDAAETVDTVVCALQQTPQPKVKVATYGVSLQWLKAN